MNTVDQKKAPQKKLQDRIIKSFLVLLFGAMISVMVVVSTILIIELRAKLIDELSIKSEFAISRIEERIGHIKKSVVNFSKNHFVINSLVHSQGREEYLSKMMEDFGKLESIRWITVADYEGKPIHYNKVKPPDYQKTLYLRPVLETAESILKLNKSAQSILIVEPILHYETPIGAVVVEIDINDVVTRFLPHDKNLYYKLFLGDQLIYEDNYMEEKSYIVAVKNLTNQTQNDLDKNIGFHLEMGSEESVTMNPVVSVVYQLLVITIVFLIITRFIAVSLGDSFAKPILKMVKKTALSESGTTSKYSPLGTHDELEILAQALDNREGQLLNYREHLEDLVLSRTEELEKAKLKAEEANRLKSEFLSTMSHELRTPLTIILGNISLLSQSEDFNEPEEVKEIALDVETSASHLLVLINEILDLSKIEAGRLELRLSKISLKEMMNETSTYTQALIKEKAIELDVSTEDFYFEADPIRLKQILLNLVSNAVKFTDNGTITIKAYKNANNVQFEVNDSGCGMNQDDLQFIYEPFRQVDGSYKRASSGTGLGLAITKRLIELHGGEIEVKSKIGEGSQFHFKIPFITNEEK